MYQVLEGGYYPWDRLVEAIILVHLIKPCQIPSLTKPLLADIDIAECDFVCGFNCRERDNSH